jgi:hypothetical protein
MADTIDEGFEAVRLALENTYDPVISRFHRCEPLRSMLAVARSRMTSFDETISGCGRSGGLLGYRGSGSPPELEMWYLSLLFVEYMAGLWLTKADNGKGGNDCHNSRHPQPCIQSRDFHLKLLGKYRDDLKTLCDQITARLNVALASAASPPSGASAPSSPSP